MVVTIIIIIIIIIVIIIIIIICRQGKPESEGWLEGCGVGCGFALDPCSAGGGGPHAAVCPQAAGCAAGHTPHLGAAPAEVCTKSTWMWHIIVRVPHLGFAPAEACTKLKGCHTTLKGISIQALHLQR